MKKTLIYLIPLLLVLATGCLKENGPATTLNYPAGTFSGEFRLLHKAAGKTKYDTVKTNIQLVLETGVGFKVLGDTSVVHAGSKGIYGINTTNLLFKDDTYPKTGTPTKTHLNGEYRYFYDNISILQIAKNVTTTGSTDTLKYQYDLKKVN